MSRGLHLAGSVDSWLSGAPGGGGVPGGASGNEASSTRGGRGTRLPRKRPPLHSEGAGPLVAWTGPAEGLCAVQGEKGQEGVGGAKVIFSMTSTFLSL